MTSSLLRLKHDQFGALLSGNVRFTLHGAENTLSCEITRVLNIVNLTFEVILWGHPMRDIYQAYLS